MAAAVVPDRAGRCRSDPLRGRARPGRHPRSSGSGGRRRVGAGSRRAARAQDDDGSVELFDSESPEAAEELLGFPTDLPDLIGEQDALAIAAEMQAGSTVLMLAAENVWAVEIASAIRDLDGQLLVMQRLPHEDVTAALRARDEITKEQS